MARPLSSCYRSRPLGYGLFRLLAGVSRDVLGGSVRHSDGLTDCLGTGVRGRGLRGSEGRVAIDGRLWWGSGVTTPPPLPYCVRSSILNIHHSPAPPLPAETALTRGFAVAGRCALPLLVEYV